MRLQVLGLFILSGLASQLASASALSPPELSSRHLSPRCPRQGALSCHIDDNTDVNTCCVESPGVNIKSTLLRPLTSHKGLLLQTQVKIIDIEYDLASYFCSSGIPILRPAPAIVGLFMVRILSRNHSFLIISHHTGLWPDRYHLSFIAVVPHQRTS